MPKNNYNLDALEEIVTKIKSNPSNSNLFALKNELNRFFTESKCIECIYTKNTDKFFFGAKTLVVLESDDVSDILLDDKIIKIDKYYLELDSKLFEIGLTSKEITAIILHEIGHCVIGGNTVADVRKVLDYYYTKNKTSLSIKDSAQYNQILKYGITDTIFKIHSIFYKTDPEEVAADTFVSMCGYGPQLESAFRKILNNSFDVNRNTPKLATLDWTLQLYKNIKFRRIPALNLLKKAEKITGSTLDKREIDELVMALQRLDSDIANEASYFINEATNKNSLFCKLKRNGLKSIEEDLYEFEIRARNAETEDEVFYTLKQINSRISILDDYIYEEDLTDHERERWYKVLVKYQAIRENIAKKKVYNKKQYGLYFDYNQLDNANFYQ